MTEQQVADLATRVLWLAFAAGAVFGAVARATRFCTLGALSDIVAMEDWSRARMWALAIGVAMAGFAVLAGLGQVQASASIWAGPRLLWLSALTGGLLFGFGMALASGCVGRNLVRLGGGNLKSLVVLVVTGIAAFATLRGHVAVARVNALDAVAVDLGRGQDLPTLLGLPPALLGGVLGLAVIGWALARREGRDRAVLVGGIVTGLVVTALFWITGRYGFVPEDPATLEPVYVATASRRMESLSFVAPAGYLLDWLMYGSDVSKRLTVGTVSLLGVVAGAAVWAWREKGFRWEGFGRVDDLALHLVGGVLMGVGGVTALGCTLGQGVSGVATLSLGSFIALAGIVAGGWAGLRWQLRRLERGA